MKENAYGLRWDRDIDPEKAEILCAEKFPILVEIPELALTRKDLESQETLVSAWYDEVVSPTHLIIEGDNLHSLACLCYTHAGRINTIITDPTYNTGRNDFMYNDAYVDKEDRDRHSKWLSFIEKRLKMAKILLHETGSIFIMIGDDEFAQLKLLCDKVFGEKNFRNCIVWNYGGGGVPDKGFSRKHDYMLFYTKSDDFKWNRVVQDYADTSVAMHFKNIDENGRRYRIKKSAGKEYKYYLDEGKSCTDVWDDISAQVASSPIQREYTGFATQKPMALFRRPIEATTDKNSIVLDIFSGSGTTGHAVLDLNKKDGGQRQFILCEIDKTIIDEKLYPRIKENMKDLGGTLKYFKTDFVNRTKNVHELARAVATTCSGMLRVKENNYNELENNESYEIYYQDQDSLLAIYKKDYNLDPEDPQLLELKSVLNSFEGCKNKTLCLFSTDEFVDTEEEFADWKDTKVELMPSEMIHVYERLFAYELKLKGD